MRTSLFLSAAALALAVSAPATAAPNRLLQQPALSRDLVAFVSAGDIWIAPRSGGRAMRLTTGVGVESAPIFSPDGRTIAFTGDYDGNVDVYTIPATGGVPHRVTWHPAPDAAVAWSKDGSKILFRSSRDAASRYTQLYEVPAEGGVPTPLPLPMAFSGQLSDDGGTIAYSPLAPAFSFDFTSYTAWGNYRGGRAGTIWLTRLSGLDSVEIPHQQAADFSPVWAGGRVYFLSGRDGPVSVYSYDPGNKAVQLVYRNTGGSDIRSLATDGTTLVFDRLGELYTLVPGQEPQPLNVDAVGDMPDVRARILNVGDQVENIRISPTGVRAVVEAHGEILTLPVKEGVVRNLTSSPGVMEREPAWSPDGQSVAYFSDEDGLYALHVSSQTGASSGVRKYKLSSEPTYYFHPIWSPDSKKIAFRDNKLNTWILDTVTGALTRAGEPDVYGGFAARASGMAWSPDSNWLVYARTAANHLQVLMLHSLATGRTTQLTDDMARAADPAFDRNGKYLYFLASNNAGATSMGLDMTSDLYRPTSSIYALALTRTTASPIAPKENDEKSPAEARQSAEEKADATPAGETAAATSATKKGTVAPPKKPGPAITAIDLADLPVEAIARRIVALPVPAGEYRSLQAGKPGTLYFLRASEAADPDSDGGPRAALARWTIEDKKSETLAENVGEYELSADGQKLLVGFAPSGPPPAPGARPRPTYVIAPADKPLKANDPDGRLKLEALEVRVDPPAEWAQMYREVWRIERAYFYDPAFHGYDTVAAERRLAPYVGAIQSRADLNYLFQEMLTGFSIGHLRGSGGAIPNARRVPGGLLGADYVVRAGRYCISKIYDGGSWSPDARAPLAQPGLNVRPGDCILAINGNAVSADVDIQQPLEGLAGQAVVLKIGPAGGGAPRDVTVLPIATEARLRNLDWIDSNRRRVAELSGGKLGYVYLPDTGNGGFTNFNRYFFAQTNRDGVIVDERFNAGGQAADYVIEVLGRKLISWWQPRSGAIDRTPAASILGPKVMIANEVSGSGGDMLPWMFKHFQLGPLVGKRTWGGLVGIGPIPTLMDGGAVTSPSVGFFSPSGQWDVENHGVEPDYPVEQDPKLAAAGHDPQLEAAVALAMQALAKAPPPEPQRPPFPVYGAPAASK
ncbi:MAG TPA: PDZ domain-containing protein [Allosphingosinicella sp.]|jgi:tricorn protease|nr:PDZ domain-containing protein [Allosphingosinicella sp.]